MLPLDFFVITAPQSNFHAWFERFGIALDYVSKYWISFSYVIYYKFFSKFKKTELGEPIVKSKSFPWSNIEIFQTFFKYYHWKSCFRKNFRCLKIENASLLNEINRATMMLVTKLCLRLFRRKRPTVMWKFCHSIVLKKLIADTQAAPLSFFIEIERTVTDFNFLWPVKMLQILENSAQIISLSVHYFLTWTFTWSMMFIQDWLSPSIFHFQAF